MEYKKVESFQETRPAEIDTESSKTKVYIRRNITEVQNKDEEGHEIPSTHWLMEEAELNQEEYKWFREQLESPALDLVTQMVNDVAADQTLQEITAEENHEEQMQLLNDIQADIAMLDTAETEE